ncbi:antibiotic biosynthesis monooxygenase [Roseibium sp. RKSG952]|uniref:antibiotic biosynthesis monooxygenase family protein n=1 Tax=Roseibium sp. RKSG952 TaxID=2529384 RepID=UPI0012BC55A4|nr:antibiotic biosynthesis monooxygenase [Roseibium sp. RKSG952]MTH99395.1 antibiotic biosynthesis monooxygenase [Roseibium sp. RKSG952]
MYVAMNRFKVTEGHEKAFEDVWKNRETQLQEVPGFKSFDLLKGPRGEDGTTLYASHVIWDSHDDFVAWTKSEHFRQAHKNAGDKKYMYAAPPVFEGFDKVEGA